MIQAAIIGASGYTGRELVRLLTQHPLIQLVSCYVSANNAADNLELSSMHPSLLGQTHISANKLGPNELATLANKYDVIFLATPHQQSHDWMDALLAGKAKIIDLSGAFRLSDIGLFSQYYGFSHQSAAALTQAVYGLAEYYPEQISRASLIAVPGCYPTASLLALKPLVQAGLLNPDVRPVINAVSGVSGAGKQATPGSHFCEVSLQAYGVLSHRHTPEIEEYANTQVIFTPHLGAFKRGILATVTVALTSDDASQIDNAYLRAYANSQFVHLRKDFPRVDDVAHTPFAHIGYKFDPKSKYIVSTCAIDNLLKGAASQAVQCANLVLGLSMEEGLIC